MGGRPASLPDKRERWHLPVLGSSASPAKPPHIANLHYSAYILAVVVVWCVVEKFFDMKHNPNAAGFACRNLYYWVGIKDG